MDPKNKILIPVIIISFVLGSMIGYIVHQPETIEKPVYINNTVEKIVEKIVKVPVTPVPALQTPTPTVTPEIPDFTVRSYDPEKDKPTRTIELTNWRANPAELSIRPGNTVLIKITDTSLQSPMTLTLNSSYTKNLGTSGFVYVTFNKKGTYNFKAIIPSGDPTIFPRTYAEGTITVY